MTAEQEVQFREIVRGLNDEKLGILKEFMEKETDEEREAMMNEAMLKHS